MVTVNGWTVTETKTYDRDRVSVTIGDGHGHQRRLLVKKDQTADDALVPIIKAALGAVRPPGPEQPAGAAVTMLP